MAGNPEVHLLTATGPISFRNRAWTAVFPDIAVFDGTYVSENVFAGDAVGTEHRRNLYRVIIGAQGVALAARMDTLEEQIRGKNTEVRDNRGMPPRHFAGMGVDAFIALPEDQEIDPKIAAKEQELQAAQRSAQLQQRAALAPATVPGFPAAFAQVLAKTVADVSADAERRVSEHLERHRMQAQGEAGLADRRTAIRGGRYLSVLRPGRGRRRAAPGVSGFFQQGISRAARRSDGPERPGRGRDRGAGIRTD